MILTAQEIANRLVPAYLGDTAEPDIAEIFGDHIVAYHNYDAEPYHFDRASYVELLLGRGQKIRRLIKDVVNDNFRCHVAADAIIFTQTVRGTLPDGTTMRIPGAIVWRIEDGRIVDVNSVGDQQQRAAFEAAFSETD